jgi:hypothetical protein
MGNIIDSIAYICLKRDQDDPILCLICFFANAIYCPMPDEVSTHNVHNESKDSSQAQNMSNIQADCFLKISLYSYHRNIRDKDQ